MGKQQYQPVQVVVNLELVQRNRVFKRKSLSKSRIKRTPEHYKIYYPNYDNYSNEFKQKLWVASHIKLTLILFSRVFNLNTLTELDTELEDLVECMISTLISMIW